VAALQLGIPVLSSLDTVRKVIKKGNDYHFGKTADYDYDKVLSLPLESIPPPRHEIQLHQVCGPLPQ
jgi:hypothetical protein